MTTPPSPVTGHANPKCYARALADCAKKISKEHYFSKAVVKVLARAGPSGTVRIVQAGAPMRELPPERTLEAKILCERHNHTLSQLDADAAHVLRAVREGLGPTPPSYPGRIVPGQNLERWLVKVLCGLLAIAKESVPLGLLEILFGYREIVAPRGLRMHAPLGEIISASRGEVSYGTYRGVDGAVSGAEVSFDGVRFILDLKGEGRVGREIDEAAAKLHRPNAVWFDHSGAPPFYLGFEWGDVASSYESFVLRAGP